jgi:hypothetical protein
VFLILLNFAYHPTQITIRSEHKRLVKNRSGGVGWDRRLRFPDQSSVQGEPVISDVKLIRRPDVISKLLGFPKAVIDHLFSVYSF